MSATVYRYVMDHEGGPLRLPGGELVLRTCKPETRNQARSGDMIIGWGQA